MTLQKGARVPLQVGGLVFTTLFMCYWIEGAGRTVRECFGDREPMFALRKLSQSTWHFGKLKDSILAP